MYSRRNGRRDARPHNRHFVLRPLRSHAQSVPQEGPTGTGGSSPKVWKGRSSPQRMDLCLSPATGRDRNVRIKLFPASTRETTRDNPAGQQTSSRARPRTSGAPRLGVRPTHETNRMCYPQHARRCDIQPSSGSRIVFIYRCSVSVLNLARAERYVLPKRTNLPVERLSLNRSQ